MQVLNVECFDEIYAIMEEAFPMQERRSYDEQRALFQREDYQVFGIRKEGILLSFIACYEADTYCFVEHLATHVKGRGSGVGKELLLEYFQYCNKPVIFEVEPPNTPIAKRRIGFYKRIGCHLYADIAYVQPSFYPNVEPIKLLLMSYPQRFSKEEVEDYKKRIYKDIYHQ